MLDELFRLYNLLVLLAPVQVVHSHVDVGKVGPDLIKQNAFNSFPKIELVVPSGAVRSCENPLIGDEGAAAEPLVIEGDPHDPGELVAPGLFAADDPIVSRGVTDAAPICKTILIRFVLHGKETVKQFPYRPRCTFSRRK